MSGFVRSIVVIVVVVCWRGGEEETEDFSKTRSFKDYIPNVRATFRRMQSVLMCAIPKMNGYVELPCFVRQHIQVRLS